MRKRRTGISVLVAALFLALLIPVSAIADQATYSLSADGSSATTRTYKIKSIDGATAVDTAVKIAKTAYPSGVSSGKAIVVRNSKNAWSDAVASSSLAGAFDCPILYVDKSSLPTATANALTQLKVKKVYIVGGSSVVDDSVFNSLKSKGFNPERIWGQTAIDTQMKVYEYGKKRGAWDVSTAFVATGKNYLDALTAGPIAFKKKWPIFYLPASGSFTSAQLTALKNSKISTFYIIGGTSVVPERVEQSLLSIAKANAKKTGATASVVRRCGANAYTTSKWVATWAVSNKFLSWNKTAFATSGSALDAAPGSVLQGKTGAPILWIADSNRGTISALQGRNVSELRILGGKSVVTPFVRDQIAMHLGFKLNDIQGFKVYIDAGHGQNNTNNGKWDPGARGNGYNEADLTQALARSVAKKLDAKGVDYFLNDDGGWYVLRHAEAISKGCNVIVSIHFNAGGGEYMASLYNGKGSQWSPKMANTMLTYLKAGMSPSLTSSKSPWSQDVAILRGTLPSTLLEVCFIDSSSNMQAYEKQEGFKTTGLGKVSTKLAEGIMKL